MSNEVTTISYEQLAQALWNAYAQAWHRPGDTYTRPLRWVDLSESSRAGWIAAAQEASRQLAGIDGA